MTKEGWGGGSGDPTFHIHNFDYGVYVLFIAIPKPSSKLKAKLGMALLSVLTSSASAVLRRPPPNLFEPGAFKPGQGLPSLTRGFQGRPGLPSQRHLETLNLKCRSQLYSKLKPGNGTALSDFFFFYFVITFRFILLL